MNLDLLKKRREELGLSLEQVSHDLKIQLYILKEIEAGQDSGRVPKAIRRGFFKSYLKYLKLEEKDLMDSPEAQRVPPPLKPEASGRVGNETLEAASQQMTKAEGGVAMGDSQQSEGGGTRGSLSTSSKVDSRVTTEPLKTKTISADSASLKKGPRPPDVKNGEGDGLLWWKLGLGFIVLVIVARLGVKWFSSEESPMAGHSSPVMVSEGGAQGSQIGAGAQGSPTGAELGGFPSGQSETSLDAGGQSESVVKLTDAADDIATGQAGAVLEKQTRNELARVDGAASAAQEQETTNQKVLGQGGSNQTGSHQGALGQTGTVVSEKGISTSDAASNPGVGKISEPISGSGAVNLGAQSSGAVAAGSGSQGGTAIKVADATASQNPSELLKPVGDGPKKWITLFPKQSAELEIQSGKQKIRTQVVQERYYIFEATLPVSLSSPDLKNIDIIVDARKIPLKSYRNGTRVEITE